MTREKIYDAAVIAALAAAAAALVAYTKQSVEAAIEGLSLCANVIIPSLFPFFALSSLAVDTGAARRLGRPLRRVMGPLFNVGGECASAVALGFIGGYPVGAKTVISLYENGDCTKTEAERLLSFCNNSGPAFIFGVVGAGVFSNGAIGVMLYLVHTAASLIVGVIFRHWKKHDVPPERPRASANAGMRFAPALVTSVKSAAQSSLNICGFVIFFTVLIRMLDITGVIPFASGLLGYIFKPLGFDSDWGRRLLTGVIELSSGVWSLKGAASKLTGSVAMAAFMLGWAGISVHSQVLSFIGASGLSARTYIVGKLLQGAISAAIAALLGRFFMTVSPAFGLAKQVTAFTELGFLDSALISCVCAAPLFVLTFSLARKGAAESGG
ncbi:MAG: sporulation protein [Oscillospiraceae bacterium]|nr:sporulation protein [Oscillospiraceae bacterium]